LSFAYLTYRWIDNPVNKEPGLLLENEEEVHFGASTKGFPVVGLRVRIFWSSWGKSYEAKVKRWSNRHNAWVIKYDIWKDTVIEDVPVVKWEFIE
jgi:hypothetical protein